MAGLPLAFASEWAAAFDVLYGLSDFVGGCFRKADRLPASVADGKVKGIGGWVKFATNRESVTDEKLPTWVVVAHSAILPGGGANGQLVGIRVLDEPQPSLG